MALSIWSFKHISDLFCFSVFVFKNFMFEFQETQDVLFDKVIEISVSIGRDTIWGAIKETKSM